MTIAVTIGCYKLTAFIELSILRWRRLVPDVPILLSDDKSEKSPEIQTLADRYSCDYICSPSRRGHFAADMQTFVNALVFAKELGVDVVIKASQRVIPILPEFIAALEKAFRDSAVQIVLPGQIPRNQIARPKSRFFTKFGVLSDVVGIRADCLSPAELVEIYRERNRDADNKKRPVSDSFAEVTLGWLIDKKFPRSHKVLPEWTAHRSGSPKLYLRKSQSTASEYAQVARMEGLSGDLSTWDLREWLELEGKHEYRPKADVV